MAQNFIFSFFYFHKEKMCVKHLSYVLALFHGIIKEEFKDFFIIRRRILKLRNCDNSKNAVGSIIISRS